MLVVKWMNREYNTLNAGGGGVDLLPSGETLEGGKSTSEYLEGVKSISPNLD